MAQLAELPMNLITAELGGTILFVIVFVGGALMCFFGARLLQVALAIAGFTAGAFVAAYIAWRVTAPASAIGAAHTHAEILMAMVKTHNPVALAAWALGGGVAGAILSVVIQWIGMFLLGAWLGITLANAAVGQAAPETYLIAIAAFGIAGGMLALIMRRSIFILSTAFNGALAFMGAALGMMKGYAPSEVPSHLRPYTPEFLVVVGGAILLGVIGSYIQFSASTKAHSEE